MEDGEGLHVRDHDLELAALTLIYVKWYGIMLRAVHGLAVHILNLGPIPLDNAAIHQSLLTASASATVVEAATRKAVAMRIAEGLRLGLTREQIIRGDGADYPGLNGLFGQTWGNRNLTIAKTELQKAALDSTVGRFQTLARGRLEGWAVSDGDYDTQCAERDGTVVSANNPPALLHPNCRLTISPIFR